MRIWVKQLVYLDRLVLRVSRDPRDLKETKGFKDCKA